MSETLVVACKLPHGLRLRIQQQVDVQVPSLGSGTTTVKQWVARPEEVVLKGVAHEFGQIPGHMTDGGYALTFGVNRDFFEAWMAQNKDTAIVKEGLVFAQETRESAVDQSVDQAEVRTGLEPLDPNKLPIKGIETADEQSTDTDVGKAAAARRRSRAQA